MKGLPAGSSLRKIQFMVIPTGSHELWARIFGEVCGTWLSNWLSERGCRKYRLVSTCPLERVEGSEVERGTLVLSMLFVNGIGTCVYFPQEKTRWACSFDRNLSQ